MFYFGYSGNDYIQILRDYAREMHTTIGEDNQLVFPEEYGTGYHQVVPLPNGLQALLIDYTINQDSFLNRVKSEDEYYILRFEEIQITDSLTVKFADDHFIESDHHRSAAILISSLFDFGYIARKNTKARCVDVIITKEWLATYLGIQSTDGVLKKYLSLKTASINFDPLDADYRQLFNEVLEEQKGNNQMKKIIIQNRIMMLVERFFARLYRKMGSVKDEIKVSNDEIHRLMHVETLLVKDFSIAPLTISEMARKAAMSETKLKTLFKKIYNHSPYEYYQKNRMLRARYLLISRRHSIKEVGMQLGYNNLSNFTIAFKKEFKMLPREI